MNERLEKQMAFALKLDEEKNVLRQTHLSHHGRRENDAEHAWHMAVMAYLLKEYSNEQIDIAKTMMMCLIHDVVEIEAGDTYAYDEEGKKTQAEREENAARDLFGILPEDQAKELYDLFEEFQRSDSAEARFVHAMDNLQPLMLNNANEGGDWKEHGISSKQVYGRQRSTKDGSETLFSYTDDLIQNNIKAGNLKK